MRTIERNKFTDGIVYDVETDKNYYQVVKEKFWSPDKGTYIKYSGKMHDVTEGKWWYIPEDIAQELYKEAEEEYNKGA